MKTGIKHPTDRQKQESFNYFEIIPSWYWWLKKTSVSLYKPSSQVPAFHLDFATICIHWWLDEKREEINFSFSAHEKKVVSIFGCSKAFFQETHFIAFWWLISVSHMWCYKSIWQLRLKKTTLTTKAEQKSSLLFWKMILSVISLLWKPYSELSETRVLCSHFLRWPLHYCTK